MQLQGREDGANAVKAGEGFLFGHMDKWNKEKEIRAEYPRLSQYIQKVKEDQAQNTFKDTEESVTKVSLEPTSPSAGQDEFLQG